LISRRRDSRCARAPSTTVRKRTRLGSDIGRPRRASVDVSVRSARFAGGAGRGWRRTPTEGVALARRASPGGVRRGSAASETRRTSGRVH
jgi:hypothetical protein